MSNGSFSAWFGISLDLWPIPQASVILSDAVDGIQFLLIGLPDGSLGLRIIRNEISEDYETDIIVPDDKFRGVVSINYVPSQPSVRINGAEIALAFVGSRGKNAYRLVSESGERPTKINLIQNKIPAQTSHPEALFIRTIIDIQNASISNDWHLLLKSSASLRLLLLDGLLHKANQQYKLKFNFRIASRVQLNMIDFDKHWHHVSPYDLPQHSLEDVNLDQFLNVLVYESRENFLTVKDVIRAAANADGGVHLEAPKNSQQEIILSLDKQATRFGQAASRHILKEIGEVVVASCIPLVEHIKNIYSRTA